jgi:hypothetical protein
MVDSMVSKRERRRLRRMNQERQDNSQNVQTSQQNAHPPEVFDSSKYDSMSDLTKNASDQLSDTKAIADLQKKEPLNPENIDNKSISSANTSTEAKIRPMIMEEQARTIREANGEVIQDRTDRASQQSSYAISDWNESMMRQYMMMVNTGIELYAQFLKASMAFANYWFNSYRDRSD